MSNRGETGAFLNNSPGNNSNSSFLAGNRKIIILVLVALLVVAAVIGTIVAVTLPKDDTGLSSEAGPGENSTSKEQTTGLASVAPPEEEIVNTPTESSNTNVQIPAVNCPDSEGFFKTSNFQCFRYFSDVGNWNSAKKRCASEGMALAKPSDDVAVELGQDLKDALCPSHICSHAVWIGGRGSGSSFKWDRDGSELSNESPLWANQQPYSKKKDRCLGIWQGDEQPYKGPPCKMSQWTLCEVIA